MTNFEYVKGAISPGDCISNAWEVVSRNIWMYIGLGFLTLILIGCIPIVNLFLMGPILGGFYYVSLREINGEPVEFGMLFKGFERFVPLMVVGLIESIPGIIWQVLQYTVNLAEIFVRPGSVDYFQSGSDVTAAGISVFVVIIGLGLMIFGILWTIAFHFAVPLVIDRDLGVGEAIKLSIQAGFSNVGGLIVLFILCGLVMLLGLVALCVGYFVAFPVCYVAMAFAYRQVFPVAPSTINYSPPPPNEYGSSFGTGL